MSSKDNYAEPYFAIIDTYRNPGRGRGPSDWGGEVIWGVLVQPLPAESGWKQVTIRYELVDGQLGVRQVLHEPNDAGLIVGDQTTATAMHALGFGDAPSLARTCLRHTAKHGMYLEWLAAFEALRARSGHEGTALQTLARIAQARVEGQAQQRRGAIRWMRQATKYRQLFPTNTDGAVSAKVTEAIKAGMLERLMDSGG